MRARAERSLKLIRDALEELRREDPDLTVQQVLTFIEVALREGTTVSQISEELAISQSTVTRNVDILGDHGRGNRRALRWVEREDDEDDRRVKRLYVNDEGSAVLRRMVRMKPEMAYTSTASEHASRAGERISSGRTSRSGTG